MSVSSLMIEESVIIVIKAPTSGNYEDHPCARPHDIKHLSKGFKIVGYVLKEIRADDSVDQTGDERQFLSVCP